MGAVQIVGVVLVSGATCWVLGWCSAEASRLKKMTPSELERELRNRGKGRAFRDW